MKSLIKFLEAILAALYGMLIGWLVNLIRLLAYFARRRQEKRDLKDKGHVFTHCQPVPPTVYKRPDPLIYSQKYLMSQGLAVTWNNPDIQLYSGRVPVSSSQLLADTEYEIRATIYNGATEAPAVNMPVDFSFLSFGIGTTSTFIQRTYIDLPVKGAPGHPAIASALWKTPATPGHYCIQVNLIWSDDANPNNNLGQENTNVGTLHSPAVFEFPVHNSTEGREHITLEVDAYTLPAPIDCTEVVDGRVKLEREKDRELTKEELCALLAERHKQGSFPVPAEWTVDIAPSEFDLPANQSQIVKVTIDAPHSFVSGTQAFNINAYNRYHHLIGGVTLFVQR